jgi:cyclomaltodextrinase / maltogenic alpha-amylase / neopullulanase
MENKINHHKSCKQSTYLRRMPLMQDIKAGKYRHYKGKEYKVLGKAKHTETGEEFVIYQQLYGDMAYWVRPVNIFYSNVEVNGSHVPRFTYLGEM